MADKKKLSRRQALRAFNSRQTGGSAKPSQTASGPLSPEEKARVKEALARAMPGWKVIRRVLGQKPPPAAPEINENRRKVHNLARWWMREGNERAAAEVLLGILSEADRKRAMKVLSELIADDDYRAAGREQRPARKPGASSPPSGTPAQVRAAVEELQALIANGGRLH